MNRKKLLAFNTMSSLLFQFTTIICGFVVPRLILLNYGSEVNGLINSITQFLALISFLELGVGAVIQSSLYKPLANKDDEEISKIIVSGQKFFSRLAKILLGYLIILMGAYPLVAKSNFSFLYSATMILVIGISSFAQYYFGIINSLLLTANQRGYFSYNIQTVILILNTIACFVLIKFGAPIHIVKLSTSLIYLFRPLLLSMYTKRNYNIDWKIEYTEEPIKQKWNGIAQHVASVVLNGTDNIVLTLFADLSSVSVYSIYNMVTYGIRILIVYITSGIEPLLGDLLARDEITKLKSFFRYVERVIHTLSSYIFGIAAVMIVSFVKVYTIGIDDANYIQHMFAMLMILSNAGCCYRLPYNLMILASGHYKQTQNNYIIAAIINIVLSIVLVSKFGLIGVSIGTLVAMFYQTIWMAAYVSKNIIFWPFKYFLKQIVIDALTFSLFIVIGQLIDINAMSWLSWTLEAVKVSIIGLVLVITLNTLFYKSNLLKVLTILKSI